MKKLLTIFTAAIMTVSLAACSTDTATTTDDAMATETTESTGVEITIAQGKPEIDAQLKAYATKYEEETGVKVNVISCGGDSCQLGQQLKSDYQAGVMPDIFQIQGVEDFNDWKELTADLSSEKWVDDTDFSFKEDGTVYGFPTAIEGWGLAYNADILEAAGVDPTTLTNYDAYMAAFETIDSQKEELGLDSVVSMAAGQGMYWVTADHDFNALLANGLDRDDLSVVNDLLAGEVDQTRLTEYANWVELLYDYSDNTVLTTGDYDSQVGAFADGKAAFCHQGNWIDGNLTEATFDMAFAPYGSMTSDTEGIFVSTPAWYCVNKESENVQAAKDFLNSLVYTDEGNSYMVNEAGSIPAFKNITLKPSGKLSSSVMDYSTAEKTYSWNQYYFTSSFRTDTLGPIFNALATDTIDETTFITMMTEAFEDNAK